MDDFSKELEELRALDAYTVPESTKVTEWKNWTDDECVRFAGKVTSGEEMFHGDIAGFMARVIAIQSGVSSDTAINQSMFFQQTAVEFHFIDNGHVVLETRRPKIPAVPDKNTPIDYTSTKKSQKVFNLSTEYTSIARKRNAVVSNLLTNLAPVNATGEREMRQMSKPSPTAAPYVSQSLGVLQPLISNMQGDDAQVIRDIAKMDNRQFQRYWDLITFPRKLAYVNHDTKVYETKINSYLPAKIVDAPADPRRHMRDLLFVQAEMSRIVVGRKGYAVAASGAMHGLRLDKAVNDSINEIIDIDIPEKVKVINLVGATLNTAYHLRNKLYSSGVVINRVTNCMPKYSDKVRFKNNLVTHIEHTVLTFGTLIRGDKHHQTLIIDFDAPPSMNINKSVTTYKVDCEVAMQVFKNRQAVYSGALYQMYVGALDAVNSVKILPSANSYKGYYIFRNYETPQLAPIEVVRIGIAMTRQRSMFPYHLVPKMSFKYFNASSEPKYYAFKLPLIDMRECYYPDPDAADDISIWKGVLDDLSKHAKSLQDVAQAAQEGIAHLDAAVSALTFGESN